MPSRPRSRFDFLYLRLRVTHFVEKVYYFLKGSGEVQCGPWKEAVRAGDFLFFPAAIEHEIRSDGPEDLEFVVCAARTLGAARGLQG